MELTGGADCGALEGEEKSERVEEEVASGGNVRVERLVRLLIDLVGSINFDEFHGPRNEEPEPKEDNSYAHLDRMASAQSLVWPTSWARFYFAFDNGSNSVRHHDRTSNASERRPSGPWR
jgi:hypothetical protein